MPEQQSRSYNKFAASMASGAKSKDEKMQRLTGAIDTAVTATFRDTGRDSLSRKRRDYWERFHRKQYGNEEEGFSHYVSNLLQDTILKSRAYVTGPYTRDQRPIVKFGDEEVDAYVNCIFRDYNAGDNFIDDAAFNGALGEGMYARVYLEPQREIIRSIEIFNGTDIDAIEKEADAYMADLAEEIAVEEIDREFEEILNEETGEPEIELRVHTQQIEEQLHPRVISIPTSEWFVYPDVPDLREAQTIGRITVMSVTELKKMFPEAPRKYAGTKNKEEDNKFWESIVGTEESIRDELEWYSRWADINATFYTSYQFDDESFANAGVGERPVVVADVETWHDIDDTGESKLYSVVKAGNQILHCEEITETSFVAGTFLTIGSRWAGYGMADLVFEEDTEITINYRMMSDAVKLSAHGYALVNEDMINFDDWINREPGSEIRVLGDSSLVSNDRPPVEYITNPSINSVGNGLSLIDKFTEIAGTSTGTGKFFMPHEGDSIGDYNRVSVNGVDAMENNSNLILDDISRRFAQFNRDVHIKIQNVAAIGGATPIMVNIKGKDIEVDPSKMKIYRTARLNVIPGATERQQVAARSEQALGVIERASQNPVLMQFFTPEAGFKVLEDYFYNIGFDNPDMFLQEPEEVEDPLQSEEIQKALEEAQQQGFQEAMDSMQAQLIEQQAKREAAATDKIVAEIDEMAFKAALDSQKQDDTAEFNDAKTEEAAAKAAMAEENAELQERRVEVEEFNAEENIRVKDEQLELEHEKLRVEQANPEADTGI